MSSSPPCAASKFRPATCRAESVRPRGDRRVRLATANKGEPIEFSLDELSPEGPRDWGRYVRGVMAGLKHAGFDVPGFDAYVDSTIPIGSGLSSSAALEAVSGLAGLTLCNSEMGRMALAKLCQTAEHEYAGVPCGIMACSANGWSSTDPSTRRTGA